MNVFGLQRDGMREARRWAIIGPSVFLVALLVLHVVEAVPRHICSFAVSSWGWLWGTAIVGLGVGVAALGVWLLRVGSHSAWTRWACLGLIEAGLLACLVAVFPTDGGSETGSIGFTTAHGFVHDVVVTSSIVLELLALVVLTAAGRRDSRWQALVGSSWLPAVLAVGACVVWAVVDHLNLAWWGALMQRVFVVTMVAWLLRTALVSGSTRVGFPVGASLGQDE